MYSFLKSLGLKRFLISEMPALSISLLISEMAYKFGSFLLECGAFLTTWYLISMLADRVVPLKKR
jgi:hypothetical protein